MNLSDYCSHDATGLADLVRRGEVSARELAEAARAAHEKVDPEINAVVEFYADAETVKGSGEGTFVGVPFLRKDIGSTEAGRLQECGSRLMKGNVATEDSYYTTRAKGAGLRYIGRSAVPEFAFAGFTETLLEGITRNPWSLDRSAGGSSGGAAAAVAAGVVPMAHASDGGGSIRIPAGWCGLVGLNPSRGRVSGGPDSQDSLFGLAREFVVCRTVRDMAAALDVFSGPEPGDPFIIAQPERPYLEELQRPTGKLRVGLARTPWGRVPIAADVLAVLDETAALLAAMGHEIEEISAPTDPEDIMIGVMGGFNLGLADMPALARSLNKPLDSTTMEPVLLKLTEQTLAMSPAEIVNIFEVMRKIRHDVAMATQRFDILLTPTTPVTAPEHGRFATTREDLTAAAFSEGDTTLFTFLGTFNATGQPSVSLPLGLDANAMPIGIQVVGRFAEEATLVRVARDLEVARPWNALRAPVHAAQ
ncbi:amidase [Shinella curvata]|uniref:Indoleacetamide hydrolase n=1 Tax=Shinella curvata TaxID=1817964 RepID=A0ABT8XEW1_9HYPH|nr:amidase [Shinella curvata]MCJ8052943.1 amidase [Shinella curvata]MDO6122274.1 amidase [Shinella curvata]